MTLKQLISLWINIPHLNSRHATKTWLGGIIVWPHRMKLGCICEKQYMRCADSCWAPWSCVQGPKDRRAAVMGGWRQEDQHSMCCPHTNQPKQLHSFLHQCVKGNTDVAPKLISTLNINRKGLSYGIFTNKGPSHEQLLPSLKRLIPSLPPSSAL